MAAVGPRAAGGAEVPQRPPRTHLCKGARRTPGGAGAWLWISILCSLGVTASATWHKDVDGGAPLPDEHPGKHGKAQQRGCESDSDSTASDSSFSRSKFGGEGLPFLPSSDSEDEEAATETQPAPTRPWQEDKQGAPAGDAGGPPWGRTPSASRAPTLPASGLRWPRWWA